jgi:hypothetical protein
MNTSQLSEGDRVEHANIANCFGTVDHNDPIRGYVRVNWDDGKIGLLYYDDGMIPNARWLLKLRARS